MQRILLFLSLTGLILIGFGGCGGGTESLNSLADVNNPGVVKNVQAYPAHRRVRLTWDKSPEPKVVGYNIYRAILSTSGFVQIGAISQMDSPFFQDEGDDANKDSIPDGLENTVPCNYKITGFDQNGRETPLELAFAVSATPGALPVDTVNVGIENLRGYATHNEIYIAWSPAPSENLFGYNVYRSVYGQNTGFQHIAIIPKDQNSFTDGGLSPNEGYIYEIAPMLNQLDKVTGEKITTGYLEGLRSQSRVLRTLAGDATTPKAPGSAANAPFAIKCSAATINSTRGVLLQFTRPSANTDGSTIPDAKSGVDDIINGAYLVFRGDQIYSRYSLVGVIENPGSQQISEFFDPYGKDEQYYYVKIGDTSGNLSAASDFGSVKSAVPPATIKNPSATSAQSLGAIQIDWNAITDVRVDGYNVYRSTNPDTAFKAIAYNITDENPNVNFVRFTDSSPNLVLGQTYYYKISVTANGLESSLSSVAAATPGPSNGILILQGENAVIHDSYLPGLNRTPAANHPAQFWPAHYNLTNGLPAVTRQGINGMFLGQGVLWVQPQQAATSVITRGERLDLEWRVDVQSLIGAAVAGTITADVYLFSADDSSTGQYKIWVDSPSDLVLNGRRNSPPGQDGFFNGIQTEINFADSSITNPQIPTRRLIGTIRIDNINDYNANGVADTEIVYMSIVHSGPVGSTRGFGGLKLDALVLVLK